MPALEDSRRSSGVRPAPHTLCVVLHYGSESETWACVARVAGDPSLDVLVADNDPRQQLRVPQALEDRARVVRTGGSAGFARANNVAVAIARTPAHDSLLLLNNDTLVQADALALMREVLTRGDVAAVGPCMPRMDDPARVWACGGVIHHRRALIHGLPPPADGRPCDVDYLPGAAILCRLDVWDRVGGLPERYFLTYEEAEFAVRVRRLGYRVMVVPRAVVLHAGGVSADRSPAHAYNFVRSRLRFARFLWGPVTGSLLAAGSSLPGMVRMPRGLSLWCLALVDEARGRPLDAGALAAVRARFGD
jgi:GT2 family glycosyltransferase